MLCQRSGESFFALRKLYGDRDGGVHRVALIGLPMGWTFSVGLLQCIQTFLIASIDGDPTQEIRPSQPFPSYEHKIIHSLYVDNFNELRKINIDESFDTETECRRAFVAKKDSF